MLWTTLQAQSMRKKMSLSDDDSRGSFCNIIVEIDFMEHVIYGRMHEGEIQLYIGICLGFRSWARLRQWYFALTTPPRQAQLFHVSNEPST